MEVPRLQPGQVVLLDIEGTTTPISFVHDVLFPFAREHVKQHLLDTWDTEETTQDVKDLLQQAREDGEEEGQVTAQVDSLVQYIHRCMDGDRKVTALKQLQGHVWRAGYHSGQLKGDLFPDVVPFLQGCAAASIPVCIYSSGSVAAQKLLFGHSAQGGDLLPLLHAHFDTTVGGKREADSYRKICAHLEVPPEAVIFLTDIFEEAEAAAQAGCLPVLSVRPGNAPLSEGQSNSFPFVEEFCCLLPPSS